MLAFTLRVIKADLQRTFRGLWILLAVILFGLLVVLPFYGYAMYFLSYTIFIFFSALIPNITKVFYVLPLGNKLMRKYLHLRAIVLASFFLMTGGVLTAISKLLHVPYLEKGWLMIMAYVQMCILLSFIDSKLTRKNKKSYICFILVIILVFFNLLNAIILINFKLQLSFSILCIIISELLLIIRLRKVELGNYVEPSLNGIFARAWKPKNAQENTLLNEKSR